MQRVLHLQHLLTELHTDVHGEVSESPATDSCFAVSKSVEPLTGKREGYQGVGVYPEG